jgi:hypothetical protein
MSVKKLDIFLLYNREIFSTVLVTVNFKTKLKTKIRVKINMFDDDKERDPQAQALYNKGEQIYELVQQITELIADDDRLSNVKCIMLEDAMMLMVKVAGAEGGQPYDIKMEAATIIRKAAMEFAGVCLILLVLGLLIKTLTTTYLLMVMIMNCKN